MSCDDERIKRELVAGRIKLWKPPYFGVVGKEKALRELADTLSLSLEIERGTALAAIENLQKHALAKLRSTGKLLEHIEVKIPAGFTNEAALTDALLHHTEECNGTAANRNESCLAEKVEKTSDKSLKLHCVNPNVTVATFYRVFHDLLNVSTIKLVCQGKSLRSDDSALLADRIAHPKGTATLLCLIGTVTCLDSPREKPDEALVQSICDAASKLQSEAGFEVTDAKGNLVPMKQAERIMLLKALGLHAIGKQRMHSGSFESSLTFLLQADHEWSCLDEAWASKVDNFGRLQLDIGWVYLQLESLENLENTEARLEQAENILRKQVHKNFLTLALVQAEQGLPVPAVAFIFVRLFLLQAVAFHYKGHSIKAKERLDWAESLAQSLRAVSTPDVVAQLCEVTNVTRNQAISALRRSNGDINIAAELASADRENDRQSDQRRKKQALLGLCENGKDFVDLAVMSELETALDLGGNQLVASGLLRLANNELERAIDVYQEVNRDHSVILRRVAELDQEQGVPPVISRKRSRIDRTEADEVALVQLESMGFSSATARQALRRNGNNVESAIMWLTNPSTETNLLDNSYHAATPHAAPLAVVVTPEAVVHSEHGNDDTKSEDDIDQVRDTLEDDRASFEEQAVDLLKQVLGEVLSVQNQGNEENLGDSLDEEWNYISKYRKEIG